MLPWNLRFYSHDGHCFHPSNTRQRCSTSSTCERNVIAVTLRSSRPNGPTIVDCPWNLELHRDLKKLNDQTNEFQIRNTSKVIKYELIVVRILFNDQIVWRDAMGVSWAFAAQVSYVGGRQFSSKQTRLLAFFEDQPRLLNFNKFLVGACRGYSIGIAKPRMYVFHPTILRPIYRLSCNHL